MDSRGGVEGIVHGHKNVSMEYLKFSVVLINVEIPPPPLIHTHAPQEYSIMSPTPELQKSLLKNICLNSTLLELCKGGGGGLEKLNF